MNKRLKNKYGKKPKLKCRAYYPRDAEGDGGRCCLLVGHAGDHRTAGTAEWIEFTDAHAEWLHPNTNGKDARIAELMDELGWVCRKVRDNVESWKDHEPTLHAIETKSVLYKKVCAILAELETTKEK